MKTRSRAVMTGLAVAVLALSACAGTSKRIRFDGDFYRAKASAPRSDRHNFTVSAGPIDRGVEGARQALLYEGQLHCIQNFGSSEIVWAVHPTEDDPAALSRDRNRIATRGRCIEWPERGS